MTRALFVKGFAVLALFGVLATPPYLPAKETVERTAEDLHKPPPSNGPIVVSVGLYVTDLVAVDEARETFDVAGYLNAKWNDPRLASPSGQATDGQPEMRKYSTSDLWTPSIQGSNTVTHQTRAYFMEVERNGEVNYWERFNSTLSSSFDLSKFPFDTQVLEFEYEPFGSKSESTEFATQPIPGTGISREDHTELAAWRVKDVRYSAQNKEATGFRPPTNSAIFQIVVQRRWWFYVWKVLIPLILLSLIPCAVFWIEVKQIDWMLKIPMTTLLSLVAFQFTIARDLPRAGYLTFMDAMFFASFVFCFLNIGEIVLVYALQGSGYKAPAEKLHRIGRWAYPLAYGIELTIMASYFLA